MTPPLTPTQLAREDRRRSGKETCKLIDDMDARLIEGDARMTRIEDNQTAHSLKLDANSADTAEVLEIVRMGKSFFRVVAFIGVLIKYTIALGAGFAAIWAAWHQK